MCAHLGRGGRSARFSGSGAASRTGNLEPEAHSRRGHALRAPPQTRRSKRSAQPGMESAKTVTVPQRGQVAFVRSIPAGKDGGAHTSCRLLAASSSPSARRTGEPARLPRPLPWLVDMTACVGGLREGESRSRAALEALAKCRTGTFGNSL